MIETRVGDWMHVGSGPFYPLDPRPEEIHIEDVARALSNVCRFGGHVNRFYSVAQHSFAVSHLCGRADGLWGLLHDASEAYLGDVVRPLKRQVCFAEYRAIEARLMAVICERFGLDPEQPRGVAVADEIMLATEARDLKGVDLETWTVKQQPLPACIVPWGPEEAYDAFLRRFYALTISVR